MIHSKRLSLHQIHRNHSIMTMEFWWWVFWLFTQARVIGTLIPESYLWIFCPKYLLGMSATDQTPLDRFSAWEFDRSEFQDSATDLSANGHKASHQSGDIVPHGDSMSVRSEKTSSTCRHRCDDVARSIRKKPKQPFFMVLLRLFLLFGLVRFAPIPHGVQNRLQAVAQIGERVLYTGRYLCIDLAA